MTLTPAPTSRRGMLAGAVGLGTLGSVALSGGAAEAALGDTVVPTAPGTSFFLSVTGVPGSSVVKQFEDQIELLTWSWGVDSPASASAGTGSGVGRPVPRPFVFAADSGIQSPTLAQLANTGRRTPSVVLTCLRDGEKPFNYLTLAFTDAVVSAYGITPGPEDGAPYDLVAVKYRKVTQTVFAQNADGSSGTPIMMSFDYATNRAT